MAEGDAIYVKNHDDEEFEEVPSHFVKRNTVTAIDLGDDVNDPFWAWLGEHVTPSVEHDAIDFKLVSHDGVPSSEPQVLICTSVVQFS